MLPVIFVVVALVLAGPAEVVGRCFGPAAADGVPLGPGRLADRHRAFTLLSFLWAPSVVWGSSWRSRSSCSLTQAGAGIAAGAVIVGVLLVETMAPGISWSPYYKITTEDVVPGNPDL